MKTSEFLFAISWPLAVIATVLLVLEGNYGFAASVAGVQTAMTVAHGAANQWPQRLRIAYLRFKLRLVMRETDSTTVEMTQEWAENPGSDHWRALDQWLTELFIERHQLRTRIDRLIVDLGR